MDDLGHIGRYETIRLLGRGGMGAVYLARDPLIDRLVAIKILAPGFDPVARARFAREARASGRLHHENIATIFDVGEHQDEPFIAMEYVPGDTLGTLIRRPGQLELSEVLRLLEEACAGLAFAHRAGIVHLDVKPENLMRREDGRMKVLDFGIARVVSGDQTQTRHLLGTLRYMAPEQLNDGPIDRRTDVFALGCVLYEAISHKPAFTGHLSEIVSRLEGREPAALPEIVPGVHPELVRMTRRAMAHDPADRYDDLEELRHELAALRQERDAAAGEPTVAVGVPHETRAVSDAAMVAARDQVAPGGARRKALVWAAAIVVGLGAGMAWRWWPEAASPATSPPIAVNQPSPTTGPAAAASGSADAPAPSAPPPAPVAADTAAEIAAARKALMGADRTATLKLLAEQPAVAAALGPELTQAAQAAAVQSQRAADARGTTAARSPGYRTGILALGRAKRLSANGQHADALTALWQASDAFARATVPGAPGAESTATAPPPAGGVAPAVPASPGPAVQGAPLPGAVTASPPPSPPPSPVAPPVRQPEAATAEPRPLESVNRVPAPPDEPSAVSAETGVRAALAAYAGAYEQRDVAALRRVYPGLQGEQAAALARTFANAVSYRLQIAALDIQVTGASAVATCTITHELVPRIGSASRNVANTRFQLKRGSDGWVIDRVEAAARR